MGSGRNGLSCWLTVIVFDDRLRPTKQRLLAPLVELVAFLPPFALTAAGLVLGLASALAAADGRWVIALLLFVGNRLVDGLDGDVARARSDVTDHGGYADIVVDTIVYAAIPLGAAAGSDIDHIWPIAGLLLASFYINTTTWTYLAALIEKRGRQANSGQSNSGQSSSDSRPAPVTSVVMPTGLVEGAETIGFFIVMLLVPAWLDWTMGMMAGAVAIGAGLRFVRGQRSLRESAEQFDQVNA